MSSIANRKMKLYWVASLKTLMSILIFNRKRKKKKDTGKTVQKPLIFDLCSKAFDLSSKNDNFKKIRLCN